MIIWLMAYYPLFNMSTIQIILMEHDIEKARNLKVILLAFEQLSGLKINYHQSELFCFGEAQDDAVMYA
jgi:hypothetical protein